MNFFFVIYKKLTSAFFLACLLAIAACASVATAPRLVDHTFGFDARVDSKDYEVLAFQYGKNDTPQTKAPYWRDEVNVRQGTNNNGPMQVGDSLYVKWRSKTGNEVYEDTVDLRSLLPRDMHRQRIYFVVQGKQLFIYRVEPVPRPPDWPVVGPRKFQYEKTHLIYPTQR